MYYWCIVWVWIQYSKFHVFFVGFKNCFTYVCSDSVGFVFGVNEATYNLLVSWNRQSFARYLAFEHIELPAKLLDYFLRSNKGNINQYLLWQQTIVEPADFEVRISSLWCSANHFYASDFFQTFTIQRVSVCLCWMWSALFDIISSGLMISRAIEYDVNEDILSYPLFATNMNCETYSYKTKHNQSNIRHVTHR